jgi:hypothetical protein
MIGDEPEQPNILPDFEPWWLRFQIIHKVPREIADRLEEELRALFFSLYDAEEEIWEQGRAYDNGREDAIAEFERHYQKSGPFGPDGETVLGWLKEMKGP